jgi:hypothetical protein
VDEVLRSCSLDGLSTSDVKPGRSVSGWEGAFLIRRHLTSLSQLQRIEEKGKQQGQWAVSDLMCG